ncbi:hypothetical protein ACF09K_17750 [Streptomyces sp. NPDC014882]|uniref:hypothetical protein n=1 Tax=Streptomyces sp. NPDC014882 TaxID=3364927 RepID=UPI0036FB7069
MAVAVVTAVAVPVVAVADGDAGSSHLGALGASSAYRVRAQTVRSATFQVPPCRTAAPRPPGSSSRSSRVRA